MGGHQRDLSSHITHLRRVSTAVIPDVLPYGPCQEFAVALRVKTRGLAPAFDVR